MYWTDGTITGFNSSVNTLTYITGSPESSLTFQTPLISYGSLFINNSFSTLGGGGQILSYGNLTSAPSSDVTITSDLYTYGPVFVGGNGAATMRG